MNKVKLWVPVLVGLMVGQLFADGERPFGLVNTLRFGYSDNIYRNQSDKGSAFVTDIVDLSFKAALSDRTDFIAKSQLVLLDDDANSNGKLYPNLYAMLNHNISPRLLLRLSEIYRSGEKSGQGSDVGAEKNVRYNYFYNKVESSADYVLTDKDRLQGSLYHEMVRHDSEIDELDYSVVGGGVAWKRDLIPQRTYSTVNLSPRYVNYDNYRAHTNSASYLLGYDTNTLVSSYRQRTGYELDNDASAQEMDISGGLNHTFNPNWQGHVQAGVTLIQNSMPDTMLVDNYVDVGPTNTSTVSTTSSVEKNGDNLRVSPLFNSGLVYSPSARTRLTGDFSIRHQPSSENRYNGQDSTELSFGAQHDLTAKLMAKATVRFANIRFDQEEQRNGAADTSNESKTQNMMDLDFRLTYKLNRINFLEVGVQHREMNGDGSESWKENRADVGWRVELN